MIRNVVRLLPLLALLVGAGCATTTPQGPPPAQPHEIAELARAISALGPEIPPDEAERAARVAFQHTHRLAREYQITDPPLIHNTKVNLGLRPRGLCYQWADDMEARLRQETFRSLELHRAIANAGNPFRIEHSTVILSRKGDSMFQGIVLDPWRKGGVLHWTPTRSDANYDWVPREQVFEQKRQRRAARRQPATG